MSGIWPRRSPGFELYFAYGSNMHLQQMAERCPGSTLYAKGRLRGYKWQINGRGVANIVVEKEAVVEGILFYVTQKNINTLNRKEGVAKGFYQKDSLQVEIEPLTIKLPLNIKKDIAATAQWLEQHSLDPPKLERKPPSLPSSQTTPGPLSSTKHQTVTIEEPQNYNANKIVDLKSVIVYLSRTDTGSSDIRPEYVERMKMAIQDARMLGVGRDYLDACLVPLVSPKEPPSSELEGPQAERKEPQPDDELITARCSEDNRDAPDRQ